MKYKIINIIYVNIDIIANNKVIKDSINHKLFFRNLINKIKINYK